MMNAVNEPGVTDVTFMTSSQVGKALALDTPLPTPSGWTTMGEVAVGDQLFDERGVPCVVVAVSSVMVNRECYSVQFSDGSAIVADAEHRWFVHTPGGKREILTTAEIRSRMRGTTSPARVAVAGALQIPDRVLKLDPYVLGAWLGDGNSCSAIITADKRDGVVTELEAVLGMLERVSCRGNTIQVHLGRKLWSDPRFCSRGHRRRLYGKNWNCSTCVAMHQKAKRRGKTIPRLKRRGGGVQQLLAELNVLANKHIPLDYLRAGEGQRWSLLQGLMDTDGFSTDKGLVEYTSVNLTLARGVAELMCSLGIKSKLSEGVATIYGRVIGPKYRVTATCYRDQPIFRLRRKQSRLRDRRTPGLRPTETSRRSIVAVDPVPSVPVKCVAVDSPSHLYLAGRSMIPTHNTEMINNIVGYFIDQEPSTILVIQPTLEMGEAWSKDRLTPMIRDSMGLAEKVSEGRAKDGANATRHKTFVGGHITVAGANSPASLASRPVRMVLFDEVDRYPPSAGAEGDPVKLGKKRTTTFFNRLHIMTSTPTVKGVSRIERSYQQSDQRRWEVPCPKCGVFQELTWAQIKFDKDHLEDVYCECAHCGFEMREGDRRKMRMDGRWVKHNPSVSGHAGFYINELHSPWSTWRKIVEDFLESRKSAETLRVWVNTTLAETWEEEKSFEIAEGTLAARREDYTKPPRQVYVLTAGVDVQEDRLEVKVKGWGLDEESWHVKREVFFGSTDQPGTWKLLDDFLKTPIEREDGKKLQILSVCVDSGYRSTRVYEYVRQNRLRRYFATKGYAGSGKARIGKISYTHKQRAKFVPLGVDDAKRTIYDRLLIEEPGPGYMHFNQECDDDYFAQLTAEKEVTKFKQGYQTKVWVLPSNRRNEGLDCEVLALCAFNLLNANISVIAQREEKVRQQAEEAAPGETSPPAPPPQPIQRRKMRRRVNRYVAG